MYLAKKVLVIVAVIMAYNYLKTKTAAGAYLI